MIHRDEQAEEAIIGAVLYGATRAQVFGLRAEDFTGPRLWVWEAVETLFSAGRAVDTLTLNETLHRQGRLQDAGGPGYVIRLEERGRLTEDGAVQTRALADHVAIVRDRSMRRKLAAQAKRLEAMTHDLNLSPETIAGGAVQALLASDTKSAEDPPDADISELAEQWSAWAERVDSGVPQGLDNGVHLKTGVEIIDEKFNGFVSNLNVIGGSASMGKTAFIAECIWNWLKADIKGGIIGLEDGTKWLTRRHLSRALGIPVAMVGVSALHEYQQGTLNDWMERSSLMYRRNLRIHRAGGIDAPGLLAIVQRWIAEGARWIVIDHGLRVNYAAGRDSRRYDMAIGQTLDALATLGDRHKCAVIVNWHLKRDREKEDRPNMDDYKESGYLEAAARAMLGLWEQQSRPGALLVTGVKVTEGERDWTVAVERDREHALVHSVGGYVVDFAAEAKAAKEAAEAAKQQRQGGRQKLF